MTSRYSHGGYGWNQELRRAVTLLETAYAGLNLSYGLSYEGQPEENARAVKVVNRGSIKEKSGGPNGIRTRV